MKTAPNYTKDQIKVLKRVIERCKKSNDDKGVKFYTELLEKGGADIDVNKITVCPPPKNTDN